MKIPCFTKLAVSPLILVRFEKFEIWHAQGSDADLSDVTVMSRATWCARWRRARDVIDLVTESKLATDDVWRWDHHGLSLVVQWVAMCYLWNRLVDFTHFLQADYYAPVDLTCKNSAPSVKWLSRERISYFLSKQLCFHGNRCLKPDSAPLPNVPAKFGARGPRNGRGVERQTNPMKTPIIVWWVCVRFMSNVQ